MADDTPDFVFPKPSGLFGLPESTGFTDSERHLTNLCRRSFLRLLAYTDLARHKALVDHVKSWTKAPPAGAFSGNSAAAGDGLQSVVIKRAIRRTRGSWTMISDEVAARSRLAEADDPF